MRADVARDIEAFIAEGGLWREEDLEAMVRRLTSEADGASLTLAGNLSAVLERSRSGPVTTRLTADIEGVLYPRLWKLMEAVWDGLPDAELRTRLALLQNRLAPLLARAP